MNDSDRLGAQLDAVRRGVVERRLETGPGKALMLGQTLDVGLAGTWAACTDPERIPRWFLPISGALRVGGGYQLEGHAAGTIETCDPPTAERDRAGFSATWETVGTVSRIEVRLQTRDGSRTRLTLAHTVAVDEAWQRYGPGATGIGWDTVLLGLAGYLGSAPRIAPESAEAWMASEDGRAFVAASSQRWCGADLAAGAEADSARAAAERTLAAYTGQDGG